MSVDKEKLVSFEKAIFGEVDERINQIIDSANLDKEKMLAKLNDEVLYQAYNEIKAQIKRIQNEYVRKASQHELDCKREVLRHREELSNKLFAKIEQRVQAFTASEEYERFLHRSLAKALEQQFAGEVTVFLRAADMRFCDTLSSVATPKLNFKQDSKIKLGGLIVYFHEQGIVHDLSIDASIESEKKNFISSGDLKIS